MDTVNQCVVSDKLQFSLTPGRGSQKVLVLINTVSSYYNNYDRVVYGATLNISKAFDDVNYYGLFVKMIKVGILLKVLNTFLSTGMINEKVGYVGLIVG